MTRKQELLTIWEERIAHIVADVHGVISEAEATEYERVKLAAQMEREWTAGSKGADRTGGKLMATEYPMVYHVDDSLLEEEIAAGECDDMSGWYWKLRGDFFGPFDTEAEAIADAQRAS